MMKKSILSIIISILISSCINVTSFIIPFQNRERHCTTNTFLLDSSSSSQSSSTTASNQRKASYYQDPITKKWKPRIELQELHIGQELTAIQIMGNQVLDGKTGPKIWVDCGVGRYKKKQKKEQEQQQQDDDNNEWKLQTAMVRLGSRGMKLSVAQKKVAKLRKKETFSVYVSRIHANNDRLEVCLTPEEVQRYQTGPPKVSVSSLTVGQELVGTVKRVENYGVLVDVGANRMGLLHIQKVADLYEEYIRKASGLEEAGLERGARIKVQVLSNQRKRLFLDFTQDVKAEVEGTTATTTTQTTSMTQTNDNVVPLDRTEVEVKSTLATDEINNDYNEEEDDEDDYDDDDDDYDEDRAIEDALGIGSY